MSTEAPRQERPRQEPSDLQPRVVLWSIASIVATLILAALIAQVARELAGASRNSPQTLQLTQPPRLENNPGGERAAFERSKAATLNSYGWIDPSHQLAHIPIKQAMRELAEHPKTADPPTRSRP